MQIVDCLATVVLVGPKVVAVYGLNADALFDKSKIPNVGGAYGARGSMYCPQLDMVYPSMSTLLEVKCEWSSI